MDRVLADKTCYFSQPKGRQDLKIHEEFEVVHYAGTVKYSIKGFMDKNKVSGKLTWNISGPRHHYVRRHLL